MKLYHDLIFTVRMNKLMYSIIGNPNNTEPK